MSRRDRRSDGRNRDRRRPPPVDIGFTPLDIDQRSNGEGSPAPLTLRSAHPDGRVMALDLGGKRVGVAISDETRLIATPLRFVARGPRERQELRQLAEQWDIRQLVAGLPTSLSGREGPQATEVRNLAESIATDLDLPLDYWDERLTSTIAERALSDSGARRSQRKEQIDAVAAAIILQDYLDHQRRRS